MARPCAGEGRDVGLERMVGGGVECLASGRVRWVVRIPDLEWIVEVVASGSGVAMALGTGP